MNVVTPARGSRGALLALLALIGLGLGLTLMPAAARADNETATSTLGLKASSGNLFREAMRPALLSLGVDVRAPWPASPTVLPMKSVRIDFPTDMTFDPKGNFPVCPDNEVGPPPVNLSVPPQVVIARCPGAVIGNGTAELYLARQNTANGPFLRDPVLVVFNGGRTKAGLPMIKVYGYSKGTTAGVYMEGVLQRDGVLAMSIPVLTSDSAVGKFDLEIPATRPITYDNRQVPGSVGRDRTYVQAKCSTGTWDMTADFTLGTRNAIGEPTSPDSNISAPAVTESCFGAAGRPAIGRLVINGPRKVRRNGRATFRVRVTNSGTAVAKRVRIVANGNWVKRGTANGGNLRPGQSRVVRVPVRLTNRARAGGRTAIRFRVTANGAKARAANWRVQVR